MMMSISALGQHIEHYKIRKQVTIKHFTELFVAYDEKAQRWVALETLLSEYENTPMREEWLSRATAVSTLDHPHISTIYQVSSEESPTLYIASQLVQGFPLSQRLEQLASQPSPVQTRYALRLIHQVAQTLADAEEAELIHFDLRPENIIIQPDDTISILDFHQPRNLQIVETMIHSGLEERLIYYAPEQLANKVIDGRSSVYTLGVLLFEMLTGKLPAQDRVVWERLYRNLRQQPTELALHRAGLSAECYQVVDRALQPERLLRFSSLAEMIIALERAIAAEEERQITPNVSAVLDESRNLRNYIVYPSMLAIICGLLLFGAYRYFGPESEALGTPLAANIAQPETAVPTETAVPSPPLPSATPAQVGGSGNAPVEPVATTQTSQTATSQPTATQTETAVPSPTASPTAQPEAEPIVEIVFSSVSVRNGPDTNFDVVRFLFEGDQVTVLAQTAEEPIWYNVRLDSGETGWLSASVGRPIDGDETPLAVPTVATRPPSPTPTATAVPPTSIPPTQPPQNNPPSDGGGGGNDAPTPRPTLTPPSEPPTLTPPRP